MEHSEEQPPHKKTATDGPILPVLTNSSPSPMEGISVVPAPSGDSNMHPSSSSGQTPNEIVSDGSGRRDKGDKQALKSQLSSLRYGKMTWILGISWYRCLSCLVKAFYPSFQLPRCLCSYDHLYKDGNFYFVVLYTVYT